MKNFFGTALRVIAAIWILNGLAGIVLSFMETGPGRTSFFKGVITVLLGWGLFRFGTWLKNHRKGAIAQRIANTRSAWWAADYGFRLSIFIGVLWIIGAYIWQERYSRDLGVVFTPPIVLIMAYFAYRKFVIGPTLAVIEKNDPNFDSDETFAQAIHTSDLNVNLNLDSDEAFTQAIRTSNLNVMKRLLESRTISPHGKNKNGRGWLQFATLASAVEPCKLLLEYGAFPLDKDDIGTSAVAHASATGNKDLIVLYSTIPPKPESTNRI